MEGAGGAVVQVGLPVRCAPILLVNGRDDAAGDGTDLLLVRWLCEAARQHREQKEWQSKTEALHRWRRGEAKVRSAIPAGAPIAHPYRKGAIGRSVNRK